MTAPEGPAEHEPDRALSPRAEAADRALSLSKGGAGRAPSPVSEAADRALSLSKGGVAVTVEDVRAYVEGLGGVLTLAPGPGDGTPEIAWGDLFFYEAPDGVVPPGQPFATVVTKDYPGEPSSGLDREGAFRVNVGASADELGRWSGGPGEPDPTAVDVVMAHPTYAAQGWLCVVDPGPASWDALRELLASAHARARARRERR